MEELVQTLVLQLAGWVEGTTPAMWNILVRQSYVQAWQNVFGAVISIILLLGSLAMFKFSMRMFQEQREARGDGWEWGIAASAILIVVFVISMISCTSTAIARFVNPEFYAIKILGSLIGID